MGKIKDLTGQKFGSLTVLEITDERRNRQVVWKCQCDCGNITYVVGGSLRNGHTQSCGCNQYKTKNVKDLTGQKFGKLTVLRRSEKKNKSRKAFWECQCECGHYRIVEGTQLRQGKVTSCYNCLKDIKIIHFEGTFGPTKDHTGEHFGLLTALEPIKRSNNNRIIWKCQCDCGNIYEVESNKLVTYNTTSCGCKKKSVGEEQIIKILKDNQIPYIRQYSFNDCLSPKKSLLLFDFAILDKNNNLSYLIEYDGIQHFKPIDYFGGQDEYEYRKQCDSIKNIYCKEHSIPLIRIPYTLKNKITLQDLQINGTNL